MSRFAIVRHGQYDDENGGKLIDAGEREIRLLATYLQANVLDQAGSSPIYTHQKIRAIQSGEILSRVLGTPLESLLTILANTLPDGEEVLAAIERKLAPGVTPIFVSSEPAIRKLGKTLTKREFSTTVDVNMSSVHYGTGWLIDLEAKSITAIVPPISNA